ncbi:unnamed protein product [Discosporangium mesarthrocarpum]
MCWFSWFSYPRPELWYILNAGHDSVPVLVWVTHIASLRAPSLCRHLMCTIVLGSAPSHQLSLPQEDNHSHTGAQTVTLLCWNLGLATHTPATPFFYRHSTSSEQQQ